MEPSEVKGHGPTTLMGQVTAAKAAKSKARLDAENDKRVKLRMEIDDMLKVGLDGRATNPVIVAAARHVSNRGRRWKLTW